MRSRTDTWLATTSDTPGTLFATTLAAFRQGAALVVRCSRRPLADGLLDVMQQVPTGQASAREIALRALIPRPPQKAHPRLRFFRIGLAAFPASLSQDAALHPRVVDAELNELLGSAGAVGIEGPKACGKTMTASQQAASAVLLDIDPGLASMRSYRRGGRSRASATDSPHKRCPARRQRRQRADLASMLHTLWPPCTPPASPSPPC